MLNSFYEKCLNEIDFLKNIFPSQSKYALIYNLLHGTHESLKQNNMGKRRVIHKKERENKIRNPP